MKEGGGERVGSVERKEMALVAEAQGVADEGIVGGIGVCATRQSGRGREVSGGPRFVDDRDGGGSVLNAKVQDVVA